MKLTLRVQSHHFADEKSTQLQLAGQAGVQANFSATVPNADAEEFPVGTIVDVSLERTEA